ncbi:S41 family peptidase [Candidatus Kapaibacterium sp.]
MLSQQQDDTKLQIDKINQVIKAASGSHVDNVESKRLVDAAIRGLLKELDPYSYYFTNEELEEISNRRAGSYYGVGFHSILLNDTLQIFSIAQNSPADIGGLTIGDKIIKINGSNVVGVDLKVIDSYFKGDKNEIMTFEILKTNSKIVKNLRLKKVKLPIQSVDASYIIDGTNIGYLAVNRFMNSTYYEVLDSLMMLNERGMQSLIIDLRGNPGGLVDQTYMVADEFIPEGEDIIITKGKDPKYNIRYKSSPNGKFENLPVVILIDSSTISAPKFLQEQFRALDRGLVVGKTSYGKGVVQNPIKLSDGSELWLTVARYFTPSGRSIHKDTVKPKPIKNKRLEERIILKDGMGFSYNSEVAEAGHGDSIPTYYSKSGRPIRGGGGITPDYYVDENTFNDFSLKLVEHNLLIKAALDYLIINGDEIRSNYSDYNEFYKGFNLNDSVLNNLKQLTNARKIDWNDEKFNKDKDLIYLSIKSIIAGMIWSNNEKYRIFNSASNQLKKAVEIMPVAEKILKTDKVTE